MDEMFGLGRQHLSIASHEEAAAQPPCRALTIGEADAAVVLIDAFPGASVRQVHDLATPVHLVPAEGAHVLVAVLERVLFRSHQRTVHTIPLSSPRPILTLCFYHAYKGIGMRMTRSRDSADDDHTHRALPMDHALTEGAVIHDALRACIQDRNPTLRWLPGLPPRHQAVDAVSPILR